MPKIVDNYVLERKIGSGQFGDVFKGYNKANGNDVAIKCVNRQQLKGKFHELLDNEIRVLRTCKNVNIIQLYDIKKTANNFYLMLEYCNEGDLMQYLKEKKTLTEEDAIEYLIQILNAFKTLVKNKIMHRDFKLANILKHNGLIKIADFGFSKLLGNANMADTMLGSPLNMAPEVLDGKEYDNKADIWSIGTCFYELLFGKPPYTASNMIDLMKNIKNKPLYFPRKVSQLVEDVIRKMLVVDPKKRIEWDQLFQHPIIEYHEEKMKKQMKDFESTLQGGEDISQNASKFYIKANKVIEHPSDIEKKKEINQYINDVAKNGKSQGQYKGQYYYRPTQRQEDNQQQQKQEQKMTDTEQDDNQIGTQESKREREIRLKKLNANRLLHERNIYVFLASVAEDATNKTDFRNSEIIGFLLVKKLLQSVDFLYQSMSKKQNVFKLEMWDQFLSSKDFQDIFVYIQKEYEVFQKYFESMFDKISKSNTLKQMNIDMKTKQALSFDIHQNIDEVFHRYLKDYCNELVQYIMDSIQIRKIDPESLRQDIIHADRVLDCQIMDQVFVFQNEKTKEIFNFKQYYDEDDRMEIKYLIKKVEVKLQAVQQIK